MKRVPKEKLVDFGVRLLTAKGVGEENARYIAGVVAEIEAMGVTTHGLVLFPYFDRQVGSLIDPEAEPLVVKEKGATALVDGNGSFAQLAMRLAKELAEKKAIKFGIAMVGVRNSSWLGALGVYLVSLARKGLFAQLWAQTNTCKDCAPFGGVDAKFSTNPVALAFPTPGDPVLADFSTAAVAMGKVNRMIRSGQKAEEKFFMDRDGRLTDDPRAMKEGGSILFVGGERLGHKGYALSLWCEALTAMSGGGCNNPEADSRQCFNLTVIDPEAFVGRDYYDEEMKRFVEHVKKSRTLPGFDHIRLPGERAFESLREAEKDGLAIEDSIVETLNEIAEKNGIPAL